MFIEEHEGMLSSADVGEIEAGISFVQTALSKDDLEELQTGMENLQELLKFVSGRIKREIQKVEVGYPAVV